MKTTFKFSNFSKANTPALLTSIGNWCLIIAAIGGAITLAPISAPIAATIGTWAAFAGTLGKIVTKLAGVEELAIPAQPIEVNKTV